MVDVLAGGARCSVQGMELNCSDVAAHLRDKLKLEPGHPVGVHLVEVEANPTAKPTVKYEQLRALIDSLEAAGFAMGKGYIIE